MGWQSELVADVRDRATRSGAVAELWLLGSLAGEPAAVDEWSDVDLGLVLTAPPRLADLVDGEVWAHGGYDDDHGQVVRLMLADGRRLDLSVGPPEHFGAREPRQRLLSGSGSYHPAARLRLEPPTDPTANEVRFLLAHARAKLGRKDRLIAGHLALEVARTCLVEAMLLRDRDTGTTIHRQGTDRDDVVETLWAVLDDPPSQELLDDLAVLFDRLHTELEPDYRPDWRGLSLP